MGRLRQLELDNFKSYLGKQVVGPFDDFTCVIGPNGSGKSNMMDAISFVLGVQSRHLRSTNLKELLYRRDAESAPARYASVRLTYELSENEIEGKESGTNIHFGRQISSAGVSSYQLNDKDVTYDKYEATLQKIGVLVKARNFLVFQGDIESVASKTPLEITKLIEQICGSDALRTEYEELLQQRDNAEETALFSLQKKKMYATQKKEIKDQKDEADLFQEKRDELNALRTEQVLMKIWSVKEGADIHNEAVSEIKKDITGMNSQEKKLNQELQNGKKSLAKVSKSLAVEEKERAVKYKLVNTIAINLDETRARIKGLQKRVNDLTKGLNNVQNDRQLQENNITSLQSDMINLEEQEVALEKELEEATETGLNLDAGKAKEYGQLREEVSAQNAADLAEESVVQNEVKSKKLQIERLESQLVSARYEADSSSTLIQEYQSRIDKLQESVTIGKKDVGILKTERDDNNRKIKESEEKGIKITSELDGVVNKLRYIGEDRFRSKQEDKIATAVAAMQKIFTGVHGKLVDLCRPIQKKYSQSIAVAAGKQMDAIVVDSKATATECIRYLKDQRAGTCIFLPLNNIEPKPVSDRLRSFAPKYKVCADLVECDDKFKPAVAYALGSTLVCDTLEEAQELCFTRNERVKVVTTQGHVISKNGAMSGGSSSSGGQDRWEEKEVERLRSRRIELEESLADNKHSTPSRQKQIDLDMKVKTLQTRIQYSEADSKVTAEKLKQIHQQNKLKLSFSTETQQNVQSARKSLIGLEKKLINIQKRTTDIENEIFKSFSASIGVANVREYERKHLHRNQELVKKRGIVAKQKASLAAQLQYELKRDFKGVEKRLGEQLEQAEKEKESQESIEEKYRKDEEKQRGILVTVNGNVDSLRIERTSVNNVVKSMLTKAANIMEDRDTLATKLAGEEILLDRVRTLLHDTLQRAQVDEIALPAVDMDTDSEGISASLDSDLRWGGSQSQSQIEVSKKSKKSSEEDSAADRNKMSKVDLSSMAKLKNMTKVQIDEIDEELTTEISSIIMELEAIQPNMHAGERYDGVVGKLQGCESELDKLRNHSKEMTDRFSEVQRLRKTLFTECYEHISETLSVIYRDLTKSSKHPVGGSAYLTLDNHDEPYLGGTRFTAMPPMKRFRDMDQLSGGEKTMAALALLFSIHSFRQAPFFVLDEVDAALDNVNVKKICNYIKQRSQDFQCIVISLKDMFFEHADSLVGIAKDVDSLSSKIYTLNLKSFDDMSLKDAKQSEKAYYASPASAKSAATTPDGGSVAYLSGGKRKVSPPSSSKRGRRLVESPIEE